MVTLLQLFRRATNLTRSEFQQHWLDHHARHGRDDPFVRRYVQYHTLLDATERSTTGEANAGPPDAYDGAAALVYDDIEAAHRALASDRGLAARDEEPIFVDQTRSTQVLVREHPMMPPRGDAPIVVFRCFRALPELDWDRFHGIWTEHASLPLKYAEFMSGYIQWRLASDIPHDPGIPNLPASADRWDGFGVGYHYSVAAFKHIAKLMSQTPDAGKDLQRFVDPSTFTGFVARRHVIKHWVR